MLDEQGFVAYNSLGTGYSQTFFPEHSLSKNVITSTEHPSSFGSAKKLNDQTEFDALHVYTRVCIIY